MLRRIGRPGAILITLFDIPSPTHTCIHTRPNTDTQAHTQSGTHTHTHTHTHTQTHTQTNMTAGSKRTVS